MNPSGGPPSGQRPATPNMQQQSLRTSGLEENQPGQEMLWQGPPEPGWDRPAGQFPPRAQQQPMQQLLRQLQPIPPPPQLHQFMQPQPMPGWQAQPQEQWRPHQQEQWHQPPPEQWHQPQQQQWHQPLQPEWHTPRPQWMPPQEQQDGGWGPGGPGAPRKRGGEPPDPAQEEQRRKVNPGGLDAEWLRAKLREFMREEAGGRGRMQAPTREVAGRVRRQGQGPAGEPSFATGEWQQLAREQPLKWQSVVNRLSERDKSHLQQFPESHQEAAAVLLVNNAALVQAGKLVAGVLEEAVGQLVQLQVAFRTHTGQDFVPLAAPLDARVRRPRWVWGRKPFTVVELWGNDEQESLADNPSGEGVQKWHLSNLTGETLRTHPDLGHQLQQHHLNPPQVAAVAARRAGGRGRGSGAGSQVDRRPPVVPSRGRGRGLGSSAPPPKAPGREAALSRPARQQRALQYPEGQQNRSAPPEVADPGEEAEDMGALLESYAAEIRIDEQAEGSEPPPPGRCPAEFAASLQQPLRHDRIVALNAQKARTTAGANHRRVLDTMLTSAKAAAAGQRPATAAAFSTAAASAARGSGTPAGKTARQTAPGTDKGDQPSSSSSSQ